MQAYFDALNKQAALEVDTNVKNDRPLPVYINAGAKLFNKAQTQQQQGDLEGAYISYKKYTIFANVKIPAHPEVRQPQFANDIAVIKKTAQVAAQKVEEVKNLLIKTKPAQSTIDSYAHNAMSKVVSSESVQRGVGNAVASAAANTAVQQKVGGFVATAATDERYQTMVGNAIAESSDSTYIKMMAQNKAVQSAVGTAVSKTAGNPEMQRKVGAYVAEKATDPEVQKKVAAGALALGKGLWAGAKLGAKAAVATGSYMIEEHNKQQQQQQQQK